MDGGSWFPPLEFHTAITLHSSLNLAYLCTTQGDYTVSCHRYLLFLPGLSKTHYGTKPVTANPPANSNRSFVDFRPRNVGHKLFHTWNCVKQLTAFLFPHDPMVFFCIFLFFDMFLFLSFPSCVSSCSLP